MTPWSLRASFLGATYSITQVGVDANELTTIDSSGALHVDGAGAVVCAVAARAVDLAIVLGVEVDDVDLTAAVVLDDLVVGVVGTTSNDVGGTITLDGDGVLTDVLEPDELQSARAQAVDTLALVGADDDVAKGSTILEDEDSIGLASLALTTAGNTTVVLHPAGIESLASGNVLGLAETLGVGGGGDAAFVA